MSQAQPNQAPVALLSITLDRDATEPLGRQLYLQMRDLILAGRLAPGARVPSTRRLCEDLSVSRTVTLTAYEQLGLEGYLLGERGRGHLVAPLARLEGPPAGPGGSGSSTRRERNAPSAAGAVFSPACPPGDLFPHDNWARALARGWRRHGRYDDGLSWAGFTALREAVADHLFSIKGVRYAPSQVLITAGGADALRAIAGLTRSMTPTGPPTAWVEDPGYPGGRRELIREGFRLAPTPVDEYGLDVEAAIAAAPDAGLVLVTPARQFPLGMTLSLPRRLRLLNWARTCNALVVEDDYDSEIRFAGRPTPSLAALDPSGAVLSLGSLSKLTFEGLRLGYVAGPERLIESMTNMREVEHTVLPAVAQSAMAEFMLSGLFAQHLRQLRVQLKRRRNAMIQALGADLPGVFDCLPQEVGMHLTVTFRAEPAAQTDKIIAQAAAGRGIHLQPLSALYLVARPKQGFVLGYAGWPEEMLQDGVRRLSGLLREFGIRG